MKFIKGVKWYYYLLPKDKCESLISANPRSTLLKKFVVCWDYFDLVHQKTNKLYGVFDSYLQFALYFLKLDQKFRCFYEIIFGENLQKPHFDVDMELENKEDSTDKKVLNDLLNTIIELIPNIEIEKDLCIYSSHGVKGKVYKRSYHIIVNNHYHVNHEEAKAFYYNVMEKLPVEYMDKHWIDHAVYSKTQQFRLYGTKKNGTDRPKIFHPIWELDGRKIVHEEEEEEDEKVQFLNRLEESIVTARPSNCRALPSFQVPERFRKKTFARGEDVDYDLAMEAVSLLATSLGTNVDSRGFPYEFDKIDGSFIALKRRKASYCKTCNRKHYHENPYLLIVENKNVFFHCRRATPDKKSFIGSLEVEDEVVYNFLKTEKTEGTEGGKNDTGKESGKEGAERNTGKESGKGKTEASDIWLENKLANLRKIAEAGYSKDKKIKKGKYVEGVVTQKMLQVE